MGEKFKKLNYNIIQDIKKKFNKFNSKNLNRMLLISEDMKKEETLLLISFLSFLAMAIGLLSIGMSLNKKDNIFNVIVFIILITLVAIPFCIIQHNIEKRNKKIKCIEIVIKELLIERKNRNILNNY